MKTDPAIALSGRLYWIVTGLLVLLPLGALAAIVSGALPELAPPTQVTGSEVLAVWAAGGLVLAGVVFCLWHMRGLMDHYRQGRILNPEPARHILRIGQGLVVLAALRLILPTMLLLILSHDNPPGQRVLAISISSDMLGLALAGCLLILIGWAMQLAARVAEENAGFV